MTLSAHTRQLLQHVQQLLSVTEDEIVQSGITAAATARIVALRQRATQLAEQYGSLEELEAQINRQPVSPDDHTLYTDLLEWRAVRHELTELTGFLEAA